MHHSFTPQPTKVREGDRFVVEYPSSKVGKENRFEILTLVSSDGETMKAAGSDGREHTAYASGSGGKDPDGNDWRFFWTLPLPDVEDDRAIGFCRAVARQGGAWHKEPPLVLVEGVRDDGMAEGKLAFLARGSQPAWPDLPAEGLPAGDFVYPEIPEHLRASPVGEANGPWTLDSSLVLDPADLPEGFRPGDLVCGVALSCHYDRKLPGNGPEGTLVTTIEKPAIAARDVTPADLHRFIRMRELPGHQGYVPWLDKVMPEFADDVTFGHEADVAYARTQPDEALVEQAKAEGLPEPGGLWMPGSIREVESLIMDGRIRLRSNPVLMTAMMAATFSKPDALGNKYLVKDAAHRRI